MSINTVGDLRKALDGILDDTPLSISGPDGEWPEYDLVTAEIEFGNAHDNRDLFILEVEEL